MPQSFKEAVLTIGEISDCYSPGLRALGANSTIIEVSNTRKLNGSVFLENCLQSRFSGENLWDYCFGYSDRAWFAEVHPAQTSEVETMIKKLNRRKKWLKTNGKPLNEIKAEKAFIWIASGKTAILPNSRQHRKAIESGLKPISKLML